MIRRHTVAFALGSVIFLSLATAFTSTKLPRNVIRTKLALKMRNNKTTTGGTDESAVNPCVHPSELPGDPSLVLVTNLDLGDKKLDVMKKCSKAISEATGKPEAYIGVSITDNASVLFGYVHFSMNLLV